MRARAARAGWGGAGRGGAGRGAGVGAGAGERGNRRVMLTPSFRLALPDPIEPGKAAVGRFDGEHSSLACGTRGEALRALPAPRGRP